jgi:antitoxin (DNA-binding transcriptional repressor) of toxin-antitoxin stability system
VAAGKEVTITRSGVPIARLIAVENTLGPRPLGFAKGQIWMADDFDAPQPDYLLASFYSGAATLKPVEPKKKKRAPQSSKKR